MLHLLLSFFNLLFTCLSCSKHLSLPGSFILSLFITLSACLSVCVKIVLTEVLLILLYYSILVHTISEMSHTSIENAIQKMLSSFYTSIAQLNTDLPVSSWEFLNFIPFFFSLLIVRYFSILAYLIFLFSIYKFYATLSEGLTFFLSSYLFCLHILSLIFVDLFSKLLFNAQMSNLLSTPPFITSHQCTPVNVNV